MLRSFDNNSSKKLHVFLTEMIFLLDGKNIAGIPIMTRTTQRSHPLDPLSAAEMRVAIATVRAAGKSPEVRLP